MCTSGNPWIPGLVLAHHPGMTRSQNCSGINAIVSSGVRFFAVLSGFMAAKCFARVLAP
jgi:hypothetical protein